MEEKRIEESRIVNRNKRQKRRQCVAEWMEESSGEDRERKRGESAFPGEQTTRPIVVDEDSKGSTHDPSFLPSFLPPTFPLSLARFQSSTEIPPLPAIVVHSRVNSPLSLIFPSRSFLQIDQTFHTPPRHRDRQRFEDAFLDSDASKPIEREREKKEGKGETQGRRGEGRNRKKERKAENKKRGGGEKRERQT